MNKIYASLFSITLLASSAVSFSDNTTEETVIAATETVEIDWDAIAKEYNLTSEQIEELKKFFAQANESDIAKLIQECFKSLAEADDDACTDQTDVDADAHNTEHESEESSCGCNE